MNKIYEIFEYISNCRRNHKNTYLCANQTNKKLYDVTREEFLTIADSYYTEFESLKESSNFYDYEKSLSWAGAKPNFTKTDILIFWILASESCQMG